MKYIDLRSDTVTQPTPEMREAMANAPVGDDVFGDDPTINQLQELAAEKVGKQAGLFVPSGTMGNLAAILTHCTRGDEAIMGKRSHTFLFEGGGISTLGGIHSSQINEQADGSLPLDEIESNLRDAGDDHQPVIAPDRDREHPQSLRWCMAVSGIFANSWETLPMPADWWFTWTGRVSSMPPRRRNWMQGN